MVKAKIKDIRNLALRFAGRAPARSGPQQLVDQVRHAATGLPRALDRLPVHRPRRRRAATVALAVVPGATIVASVIVVRRVTSHDDMPAPPAEETPLPMQRSPDGSVVTHAPH